MKTLSFKIKIIILCIVILLGFSGVILLNYFTISRISQLNTISTDCQDIALSLQKLDNQSLKLVYGEILSDNYERWKTVVDDLDNGIGKLKNTSFLVSKKEGEQNSLETIDVLWNITHDKLNLVDKRIKQVLDKYTGFFPGLNKATKYYDDQLIVLATNEIDILSVYLNESFEPQLNEILAEIQTSAENTKGNLTIISIVIIVAILLFIAFLFLNINISLERKVRERTAELKKAMDELWGEMELARKIQTVLLPKDPGIDKYTISAYMETADKVGGDYYDVINVDGYDWVLIGDVSGHGITAGLVMMMVQTAIHVVLDQNPNISPKQLLSTINKTIADNIKRLGESKFMTMVVLAVKEDNNFEFSGMHLPILVYRAGTKKVETINTEGMWLGFELDLDEINTTQSFNLEKDDVMILYSDGVTEAFNEKEEMFSEKSLIRILEEKGDEHPDAVRDKILDDLKSYRINDDVSFMVLKRNE